MGHNDNRDTLARDLFTRDPEEIMAHRFGLVSAFINIKKVTWRRYAWSLRPTEGHNGCLMMMMMMMNLQLHDKITNWKKHNKITITLHVEDKLHLSSHYNDTLF